MPSVAYSPLTLPVATTLPPIPRTGTTETLQGGGTLFAAAPFQAARPVWPTAAPPLTDRAKRSKARSPGKTSAHPFTAAPVAVTRLAQDPPSGSLASRGIHFQGRRCLGRSDQQPQPQPRKCQRSLVHSPPQQRHSTPDAAPVPGKESAGQHASPRVANAGRIPVSPMQPVAPRAQGHVPAQTTRHRQSRQTRVRHSWLADKSCARLVKSLSNDSGAAKPASDARTLRVPGNRPASTHTPVNTLQLADEEDTT